MFYMLKFIINIFLFIMSLIGAYFTYKKIQYSDFMIVKFVILIFAAICFFVFAIKYLREYKHN